MTTWLVPREELTLEQVRAVELSPEEHRIVFGAPGSGKTIILVHRARYLADKYHVPPERFHIFVFNNVLKTYIQKALELLDIPESAVTTYDGWCIEAYRRWIGRRAPWNEEANTPDFPRIRQEVYRWLQRNPGRARQFDFLLVDEGQDLDRNAFETMKLISQHVTVCMDHKQRIYETGADEQEILKALGLKKRNVALLEAFRCTPYIVDIAASFVEDPEERQAYIRQNKQPQMERETPLLYYAKDHQDEMRRLAGVIKTRQAKGEKVAVLLPHKRLVYGFAKGLKAMGLEVEVPAQRGRRSNGPTLDFSSDYLKVMPYHSAKGLTFDSVLMPALNARAFSPFSGEQVERLVFVGTTRATKWVFYSTVGRGDLPGVFRRFEALARSKALSIQDGGWQGPVQPESPPPQTPLEEKRKLIDWF